MITAENYYSVISKMNKYGLPAELKAGADFVDEVTENGKDWSLYHDDVVIKKTIDEFFSLLEKEEKKGIKVSESSPKAKVEQKEVAPRQRTRARAGESKPTSLPLRVVKRKGQMVERISEELKFLDTYVGWDNKLKNIDQVRRFLSALQRAITEKRMRESSKFAEDIEILQDDLIRLHNSMINPKSGSYERIIRIKADRKAHLLNVVGKQELMHSIKHMKSYISLQGKEIPNKKAQLLHNRIGKDINNGTITEKDPYWKEIEELLSNLRSFFHNNPVKGILSIPTRQLNGLNGILSGFGNVSLSGIPETFSPPKNTMMNSMDFIKLEFEKIGFTGKWLEFIGNPSKGFIVLVYGPPKYGKSIMCVDFARYLAENFGKVLYVAKEEGLDDTLKEKLVNAAHPNLIVSDYLPDSFSGFDFVFLDSITRLGLTPAQLLGLKENFPQVSIIAISQVTKSGKARGSNVFSHDVDSIIEFPERGKAVQYGRFNQGGELNVFH